MCRTIPPSSLGPLSKQHMRAEVLEGETLLAHARELVSTLPVVDQVTMCAVLDQRVIMHLLGKGSILGPTEVYAKVTDICKVTRLLKQSYGIFAVAT